jgi:hypothetical protein
MFANQRRILKMNKSTGVLSFFFAALLIAGGSLAQGGPAPGGPGPGWGDRPYDPKTVETVRGEVVSVAQVPGKGGGQAAGGYGVHLTLKSDKEEIAVHLGPGWFLEQNSFEIAPTDQIEVRGSRTTVDGAPAIIAAEVKKGEQSLQLRNQAGVPAWRGLGRRAPLH